MGEEFKKDLKGRLTPLQYHVTQEAGTERAHTGWKLKSHLSFKSLENKYFDFPGKFNKFYEQGTYVCVVCKQELFSSETKYDSGCGWPAFYDVLEKGRVTLHNDPSLGNYEVSRIDNGFAYVFVDFPIHKLITNQAPDSHLTLLIYNNH